jgi:hypothetical protein
MHMPGNKTHEHQVRQFEQGVESQDRRADAPAPAPKHESGSVDRPAAQESSHNKHNNPGQDGHGRQSHGAAEEKQT